MSDSNIQGASLSRWQGSLLCWSFKTCKRGTTSLSQNIISSSTFCLAEICQTISITNTLPHSKPSEMRQYLASKKDSAKSANTENWNEVLTPLFHLEYRTAKVVWVSVLVFSYSSWLQLSFCVLSFSETCLLNSFLPVFLLLVSHRRIFAGFSRSDQGSLDNFDLSVYFSNAV